MCLRVNDLHIDQAWTQPKSLEIVLDDGKEVVVVAAIAVAVQVGGVLSAMLVCDKVFLELFRDAMGARGELQNFCSACVVCKQLQTHNSS